MLSRFELQPFGNTYHNKKKGMHFQQSADLFLRNQTLTKAHKSLYKSIFTAGKRMK